VTIQWITNAYGVKTCHKNDVRLSYDESRLATVTVDHATNKCFYRLEGSNDLVGTFDTEPQALRAVERAVGGKRVEEVYR
jgi:hypothetical protein